MELCGDFNNRILSCKTFDNVFKNGKIKKIVCIELL